MISKFFTITNIPQNIYQKQLYSSYNPLNISYIHLNEITYHRYFHQQYKAENTKLLTYIPILHTTLTAKPRKKDTSWCKEKSIPPYLKWLNNSINKANNIHHPHKWYPIYIMIRKKKYEDNIQKLHNGTYKNRKYMITPNHQRILIHISACTPRYRIIPLTHKNNHSNLLRHTVKL